MARTKKRKNKIILPASIGGGVTALVLVAVFIFGFGVDTLPHSQPASIPFPDLPVGEVVSDEQTEMIEMAMNNTVSSNQTTPEQVIDKIAPKTLKLEGTIVKIDSLGNEFPEAFEIELPALAVLVEDITQRDFATGFIDLNMSVVAEPNIMINADGVFDILIGGQTIFTESDVLITASGVTDSDGKLPLTISGLETFKFPFSLHFDKFTNQVLTKLEFSLRAFEVTVGEEKFGVANQEFFSMDILRDDIKILIEDSQGNPVIAYPQDSRITITSNESVLYTLVSKFQICPTTSSTTSQNTVWARVPAVTIGTTTIVDDISGQTIDAGAGVGLVLDTNLFRNHNYTVNVGSPINLSFKLTTEKDQQQNFQYKIWTDVEYGAPTTREMTSGLCTNTFTTRTPISGTEFVTHNFP